MNPKTCKAEFDPKALPMWAQEHPAVVALAAKDLSYRCDVCQALSYEYERWLIHEAIRRL